MKKKLLWILALFTFAAGSLAIADCCWLEDQMNEAIAGEEWGSYTYAVQQMWALGCFDPV